MLVETKIRKAFKRNQEMKAQIQKHEEELQKANPFKLVKAEGTTFLKFDPERFQKTLNEVGDKLKDRYSWVINHVLIGSLGDPETWEGTPVNVAVKKGDKDGLPLVIKDLELVQRILYQRPSGKYENLGWHFTHRLQSVLLADTNSVIKRQTILDQIKETARTAVKDPDGEKYIALYYSGHGEENTGNWVFKDGVITLQNVLD